MLKLQGKYYRSLLSLGLPIMVGQLGIIIVGFVDNIMVGHHSTLELSAASFVNNMMNLAFIMGMGFSYGLTPLVTGSLGSKDGKLITWLKSGLLANAFVGVLLTLIMGGLWFYVDKMGQPQELLPYIRPYYLVQLSSILVTMLFNGYKQFSDGVGRTMDAMLVLLASNVINIVLNYLLIFGVAGFPELGLLGAGVSTLVARLFCCVALWGRVSWSRTFRSIFERAKSVNGAVNSKALGTIFRLGSPIALQMGVEAASFSLSVIVVGWVGSTALAAHQVMSVVSTVGFMMYYGLSAAVTIEVSKANALGKVSDIRGNVTAGIQLLACMAACFLAFLLLGRDWIGRIFTTDTEVIRLVSLLCYPMVFYQAGDIFQILYSNTLRGLRDVTYLAVCAVICHLGIALSLVYTFGIVLQGGVVGVWYAFPFSLTALGFLLYLRYRKVLDTLF